MTILGKVLDPILQLHAAMSNNDCDLKCPTAVSSHYITEIISPFLFFCLVFGESYSYRPKREVLDFRRNSSAFSFVSNLFTIF